MLFREYLEIVQELFSDLKLEPERLVFFRRCWRYLQLVNVEIYFSYEDYFVFLSEALRASI